MAESFYGGRAGHDFTIYYCYSSPDEMKEDFKKINSHTPIGGYCLDTNGHLYRRMINNEALSLGNAAIMGIKDLQNTFLYRDGANIILRPTNNIPTKILTMEGSSFTYCGISGDDTNISVSMVDNKIKINHNSKSFTPTTAETRTLSYGSEFEVPILGYDEQGHVSSKLTQKYKLPAAISYSAGTGISLNNNTISLNAATDNSLGGIKTGYTESGKNYAVKLDSNKKAYVTVPWTNSGGTVTSVSVKVNGSVKGTVTSSGEIDLGTLATTDTKYSAGGGLTLSGNTFSLGGGSEVTLPLTIKGKIKTGNWIRLNDSMTKLPKNVGSSYCIDWSLSDAISLEQNDKLRIYSSDTDGFLASSWISSTKDETTPCIILRSGTNLQTIIAGTTWGTTNGSGWYFTDFETNNGCYTALILKAPKKIENITSMSLILPTDNKHVNTDLQTRSNAYLGTNVDTQTVTLLKIDEYGKTTFYDYNS